GRRGRLLRRPGDQPPARHCARHPRRAVHRRRRLPRRSRRSRRPRDGGGMTAATITRANARELVPAGRLYLGGTWLDEGTGGGGMHRDPTTGEPVGPYILAGEKEVDAAV